MFKWLRGESKADASKHYAIPVGECIYAIGDIHGCFEPMFRLLREIERRAREDHPEMKTTIVFLGDLVDRGSQSAEVVEYLLSYNPENIETIFLMGNHEEIALDVLDGNTDKLHLWFNHGGRAFARSYQVTALGDIYMDPENLAARIRGRVPERHRAFMSSFVDFFRCGDYLFVHAGIDPRLPLEAQKPAALRWIRGTFLNYNKPYEFKVVHGHSVVEAPEDRINRIAVDTGVYDSGILTAVCLHGTQRTFVQSHANGIIPSEAEAA